MVIIISLVFSRATNFRFANNYGSNMVLQRAPQRAVLWGFGEENQKVVVSIKNSSNYIYTKVWKDSHGNSVWKVTLPPIAPGGPYKINAISTWQNQSVSAILENVLFGDVWFCSGQSNMGFTVGMSSTAAKEIKLASNYPKIRLFTMGRNYADEPIFDLLSQNILQEWSQASPATVGGLDWTYFSALCWMYGRHLYDLYKIPIGLISSKYGNTSCEAWSSPTALSKCGLSSTVIQSFHTPNQFSDEQTYSSLWNAMIFPHLNTTIKGVVWYQGEHNSIVNPDLYACVFPALIDDWRKQWFEGTDGITNKTFPFGFVQLAPIGEDFVAERPLFPKIRWEQTANYGFVPNSRQQNVFMAVAMDLPDDQSPYGSIHPRDKSTIAERLILGARSIIYGEDVTYQGPILDTCQIIEDDGTIMARVLYRSISSQGIIIKSLHGFEGQITGTTEWVPLQIISVTKDKNGVYLSIPTKNISIIRYAWNHRPCDYKECAIYSVQNDLPSPPSICYIV